MSNTWLITACFSAPWQCSCCTYQATSLPQEENKSINEVNIGPGATVCPQLLNYAAQAVWGIGMDICFVFCAFLGAAERCLNLVWEEALCKFLLTND